MPASGEFRLSITRALADQLSDGLAALDPAPLDPLDIAHVDPKPGVYQLYENGTLIYVGKAQASEPLPKRLRQHYDKLTGRLGVGAMTFTCLYVHEDMEAVSPEQLLITKYKGEGEAAWNFMGFGSKDPGKERDTTRIDADHFDAVHPINLDFVCPDIKAGTYIVADLLKLVKKKLPFLFRYESAPFHAQLDVKIAKNAPTANELFEALGAVIADADPKWRITALPGYVIMYPKEGPYPHALRTYD
jgi:hypothetical protein